MVAGGSPSMLHFILNPPPLCARGCGDEFTRESLSLEHKD